VSQVEGTMISQSYAIVRGRIGITCQRMYATNMAIRSSMNVLGVAPCAMMASLRLGA